MTAGRWLVGMVVVALWAAAPVAAQDLPSGTWTGTVRNPPPRNPNPRPVALEVKRAPDPLWRWRGGSNEIVTVSFRLQQNSVDVGEIQLADGRLAFALTVPGEDTRASCVLTEQADGRYQGECQGLPATLITLMPPEAAPAPEK